MLIWQLLIFKLKFAEYIVSSPLCFDPTCVFMSEVSFSKTTEFSRFKFILITSDFLLVYQSIFS